jgi:uncharacterized membrane protein
LLQRRKPYIRLSEGVRAPGFEADPSKPERDLDGHGGELPVILFRGGETHSRSVLKAISWRTLGTLDTFALSWFMTGRIEIAGSIAGLEVVTKIAWYYLHERIWASIAWGRR